MAEEEASFQPKAVKDVPAEQFISAYAAHLKTNDKVRCWRRGREVKQHGSNRQDPRPQLCDWRSAEACDGVCTQAVLGAGQQIAAAQSTSRGSAAHAALAQHHDATTAALEDALRGVGQGFKLLQRLFGWLLRLRWDHTMHQEPAETLHSCVSIPYNVYMPASMAVALAPSVRA